MARLFLSHSSFDNATAIALFNWFRECGWDDVFLDLDPVRGIAAGERWERALSQAANRCEAVVCLVSRAWLKSQWCRRELQLANKLNKRVFGVLIEDLPIEDVPSDLTAHWQLVSLSKGSDHQMMKAELPDGTETHVTLSKDGLRRLRIGLEKAGVDPKFFAWPPPNDINRAPYPGLRPLDTSDAGIFFGREADIILALDRLRGLGSTNTPSFLVLLGASGAGKSSFLRAGLWPRLKRDDRNFLPLPVLRPGRGVITGDSGLVESIKTAFEGQSSPLPRGNIEENLLAGQPRTEELLMRLASLATVHKIDSAQGKPPILVLFVDQAEELFGSDNCEETKKFLALLQGLLKSTSLKLVCVAAIRSDLYERLQIVPELSGIQQETLSLPPISEGAFGQIIEGPAVRLSGGSRPLTLDPQLTQRLLRDIGQDDAKDALPLLAFTLERLYREEGNTGKLTLEGYERTGGIAGSINAAVEDAFRAADTISALPPSRIEKLALIRRGFIPWLARIDPETRQPSRRVARQDEIPLEARSILKCLVEARLLSTDRDDVTRGETVELAHESLLRKWQDLASWLAEDAEKIASFDGVKRAADEWNNEKRAPGWLSHQGGRLRDIERHVALNTFPGYLRQLDREYLSSCRENENQAMAREQGRRRTIYASSFTALVMLLGVLGYFFYSQSLTTVTLTLLQAAGDTADDILLEEAKKVSGVERFFIDQVRRRARDKIKEVTAKDEELGRKEELIDEYINIAMTEDLLAESMKGQAKSVGKSFDPIMKYIQEHMEKTGYLKKVKRVTKDFMMENYSTAQMRALLSFQKSPLGRDANSKQKKMASDVLPAVMSESVLLGQRAMQQLTLEITKVPGFESFETELYDAFSRNDFTSVSSRSATLAGAIEKNEIRILGAAGIFTIQAQKDSSLIFLLNRDPRRALEAADRALRLDADFLPILRYRAHALLFLGRKIEAKKIYITHKQKFVRSEQKTWDDLIAEDFVRFDKLNIGNTNFGEILELLSPSSMPTFSTPSQGAHPGLPQSQMPISAAPTQTSPSTAPKKVSVPRFATYRGYDLEVDRTKLLGEFPLDRADQCEATCINDPQCKSYSYNRWSRKCFTKSEPGSLLRFDPRTISGISMVSAVSRPTISEFGDIKMWVRLNKAFPNKGQTRYNLSRDECSAWCSSRPLTECVAFTSFRSNKECRIFPEADEYTDNADADIGYRIHPPRQ